MKKIAIFFPMLLAVASADLQSKEFVKYDSSFDGAVSAGYVFKHECEFKEVYGSGIINAITFDGCYYPWQRWGLGAKLSYWRKKGCTSFLQLRSVVQQLPFTLYLRRRKEFDCGLQLYGSLGGGIIWTKEKSYLGCVNTTKGIAEAEAGVRYALWRGVGLTGAIRALFPSQDVNCCKARIGGIDLRAGISFSF